MGIPAKDPSSERVGARPFWAAMKSYLTSSAGILPGSVEDVGSGVVGRRGVDDRVALAKLRR